MSATSSSLEPQQTPSLSINVIAVADNNATVPSQGSTTPNMSNTQGFGEKKGRFKVTNVAASATSNVSFYLHHILKLATNAYLVESTIIINPSY